MDIDLAGLDASPMHKSTEEDLGTGSVLLCPGVPLETPEGHEKEREPMMSVADDHEAAKSDDGVSLSLGTVHYTDDERADECAGAKDVL